MIGKILEEMAKKQGKTLKINHNPEKMIRKNNAIIIPDSQIINNNVAAVPFFAPFIPQAQPQPNPILNYNNNYNN